MNSLLTTVRQSKPIRTVAAPMVTMAMMFSAFAPALAGHSKPSSSNTLTVPGIRSVAFFPVTNNNAGSSGDVVASTLDHVLILRLVESGAFEVTAFNHRLPSIQRALNYDNTLTQADINSVENTEQPTDPVTAQKIAQVMDTDGYMLDEVDAYQQDSATGAITVTVSGNLYNTASGSAVRTFAVTGSAAPTVPGEGSEAVLQNAVQNAADQILTSLNVTGPKSVALVPHSNYHQSSTGTILLVVLAGALIGVIAHNNYHPASEGPSSSSSSSSSGGGSSGAPGPPSI